MHRIQAAASRLGWTLWRNNVGRAWAGSGYRRVGRDVLVLDARPIDFGLCSGSADLVGIRPVVITEDMVGQTLGVFVGVEVKTKTGRVDQKQDHWRDFVKNAGGVAIIARSEEDLCSK